MRSLRSNQLWLGRSSKESSRKINPITRELLEISRVLDECPGMEEILIKVRKDLVGERRVDSGKTGLTAEQALRAALVKEKFEFSYRELEFHLSDSLAIRGFIRLEPTKEVKKSVLNRDIRLISEQTWESFNEQIKKYAKSEEIEDGTIVRSDTTATKSNVQHPTDSGLLCDCIRVLTRLMKQADEYFEPIDISYSDHNRRAKRRKYKINNCKKSSDLEKHYLDLIKVTGWVQTYATNAVAQLEDHNLSDYYAHMIKQGLVEQLRHYLDLTAKVLSQAIRRVLQDEEVPAQEKVFSIFETHTDIIKKGGRETVFGHKICVSSGKSGLILDCMVLDGNPCDTTLVEDVIVRHKESYGEVPQKIVFDGGFACEQNVAVANKYGVKDTVFPKKKGIHVLCSDKTFKMLSNFRAGIEAGISALKRSYGFGRVIAKGLNAFKTSLLNGLAAFNLTLIARHRIQKA